VEDIVAIKVTLSSGQARYFLTWGRIPERIDPQPLLAIVGANLHRFDMGGTPTKIDLCPSLQDAAGAPYFFEALFAMCQRRIPRGAGYTAWRKATLDGLVEGKELHYLGRRRWRASSMGRLEMRKATKSSTKV